MSSIAIVVDSTASLPESTYSRHGLVKVAYYVHADGRAWRDTIDITTREMCEYMAGLPLNASLPQTATPSPEDYRSAFVRAARDAADVISFHMTSTGSGAYQAALLGRDMALADTPDARIHVVDTRNVSMCHGWIALLAARAAEDGATVAEVMRLVREAVPHARMLQTADTLRYLFMGGRTGRAGHLVGSMLRIKPLISMDDGVIVNLGVARSRTAAYERMAAMAPVEHGGTGLYVATTQAGAADDALELARLIEARVSPQEVLHCELSPALIVHTGPGTVGYCYVQL